MSFGWAYVGCDDIAVTSMTGPTGSILVRSSTFGVSGSENFMLYHEESSGAPTHNLSLTGSFRQTGNYNVTGSVSVTGTMNVLGPVNMWSDLIVEGNITANSFDVVHTTVTEVQTSGSTAFGNDVNDTHGFTGKITFAGAEDTHPAMVITASAPALDGGNTSYVGLRTKRAPTTLAVSGSFSKKYDYMETGDLDLTNNITGSIVGVRETGAMTITLPTAHGTPGRILIIKDEGGTQPRTNGNKITVNPQAGETIDDQPTYYIMGSRAALSLYADGLNQWFIF